MGRKVYNIEITIEDDYREAMLYIDGQPVQGHSDSTNSLPIQALVSPLTRRIFQETRVREDDETFARDPKSELPIRTNSPQWRGLWDG